MKAGVDQLTTEKKKKIAAAVLLPFSVLLLLWMLHQPSAPPPAAPPAAKAASTPEAASSPAAHTEAAKPGGYSGKERVVAFSLAPTLDPRLRLDLLKQSEGTKYEGSGRNIFGDYQQDIPKPVAPGLLGAKPGTKVKWVPPPPPPPPPINLKFYGWASGTGAPKAIFLMQNDNTFVAHEGDIVAHRYKVVRIGSNSVEVEDVLSNHTQDLPLAF